LSGDAQDHLEGIAQVGTFFLIWNEICRHGIIGEGALAGERSRQNK